MCVLKIKPRLADGERVAITVGNERKILEPFADSVPFELPKGRYSVKIEQLPSGFLSPLWSWLLYFLTIMIQGIMHVLLFSFAEDDKPDPHLVSASGEIVLAEDSTEAILTLKRSKEKNAEYLWQLSFEPIPELTICYTYSEIRARELYLKYVKKVCSVSFILLSVFVYLFFYGLQMSNVVSCVICAVFFVIFAALGVYLILVRRTTYLNEKKSEAELKARA